MASAAIKVVAGAAALLGVGYVALKSKDANAAPGGRQPQAGPEGPFDALFLTGPDGAVAFRPEVAAQLYHTRMQVSAIRDFAGGGNGVVEMMGTILPGQLSAAQWAANQNGELSILASKSIVMPVQGPPALLKAVTPGQEKAHTAGPNAVFAIFALPGALSQFALPGSLPTPALPAVPGMPYPAPGMGGLGGDEIPPMVPGDVDMLPPMPDALAEQFEDLLSDPNADPGTLDTVASILKANGYDEAADLLQKKAAEQEVLAEMKEATGGFNTIELVSDSVTPGHVAIHYTGSIARFKEIAAANPGMQVVGSGNNQGLSPWYVGMGPINLPASWDTAKGPPNGTVLA